MSTDLYNQIYRCRKCGKEFCPVTTHVMTGSLWRIAGQLMMLFGTLITAIVH